MTLLNIIRKNTRPTAEGCWEFTGRLTSGGPGGGGGYASATFLRQSVTLHRVAYELANGAIPDGMTLDHRCRNRACVNPDHLEVVGRGENVLRGEGPTAKNALKTACPLGHPYDERNTYLASNGWRYCRTCMSDRKKKQRANQATAGPSGQKSRRSPLKKEA